MTRNSFWIYTINTGTRLLPVRFHVILQQPTWQKWYVSRISVKKNCSSVSNISIDFTKTWNDELAKIACCNARTCDFKHDPCRSTDDHKYAGQNLAIVGQSQGYKEFRDAYEDLHTKWFLEHQHCDMHNIRKYQNKPIKAKLVNRKSNIFLFWKGKIFNFLVFVQ